MLQPSAVQEARFVLPMSGRVRSKTRTRVTTLILISVCLKVLWLIHVNSSKLLRLIQQICSKGGSFLGCHDNQVRSSFPLVLLEKDRFENVNTFRLFCYCLSSYEADKWRNLPDEPIVFLLLWGFSESAWSSFSNRPGTGCVWYAGAQRTLTECSGSSSKQTCHLSEQMVLFFLCQLREA